MKANDVLRKELLALLEGRNAHMSFDDVLSDFPLEHINSKAPDTPYSFWHFVEHIRIAQWDILEFIRNPDHVSPKYPEGYRPRPEETTDEKGWRKSIEGVQADLEGAEGNRPGSEDRPVRPHSSCPGLQYLPRNRPRCRSQRLPRG